MEFHLTIWLEGQQGQGLRGGYGDLCFVARDLHELETVTSATWGMAKPRRLEWAGWEADMIKHRPGPGEMRVATTEVAVWLEKFDS